MKERDGIGTGTIMRCFLVVWILLAVLALDGCNDGGGSPAPGERRSKQSDLGKVMDVGAQALGDGTVQLTFRLEAPRKRSLDVLLEFSEDAGLTFRPGASTFGPFATGKSAGTHAVLWRARDEISRPDQHDLKARLTPLEPRAGRRGAGAESETFGVGANTAPRVARITPAAAVLGGLAVLETLVEDAERDHVRIEAEFAVEEGPFRPASLLEGEVPRSTEPGAPLTVRWDAARDLPEASVARIRFRARATDTEAGEFAASSPFGLRTLRPRIAGITVESIEEEMNGSTSFLNRKGVEEAFELLLPAHGFTLSLLFEDVPGGSPIAPESLVVHSNQALGKPGEAQSFAASENLAAFFGMDQEGRRSPWQVPASLALHPGRCVLTATVEDALGNRSEARAFAFSTAPPQRLRAPFEDEDVWFLDFDRDNFAIEPHVDSTGRFRVESRGEANGIPDYVEDLGLIGLALPHSDPGSTARFLSERMVEVTKGAILTHVYRHFGRKPDGSGGEDAVRIRFALARPPEPHSRMALGGDDPIPGDTIGRAAYDHGNARRNDNSSPDLGVFCTNIVDFHANWSFAFRQRFDPFIPGRGTPVGTDPWDAAVLGDAFDRTDPANDEAANARHDGLIAAADAWARMVALVTAHEVGHSIGLVANGPPPRGLFGGESRASFAGPYTNPYHLDGPGNDVMAAALSFADALLDGDAGPRFNHLCRAYLLERVRLR